MKKFITRITCISLIVLLTSSTLSVLVACASEEQTRWLYPVLVNKKWGYIDKSGTMVAILSSIGLGDIMKVEGASKWATSGAMLTAQAK